MLGVLDGPVRRARADEVVERLEFHRAIQCGSCLIYSPQLPKRGSTYAIAETLFGTLANDAIRQRQGGTVVACEIMRLRHPMQPKPCQGIVRASARCPFK